MRTRRITPPVFLSITFGIPFLLVILITHGLSEITIPMFFWLCGVYFLGVNVGYMFASVATITELELCKIFPRKRSPARNLSVSFGSKESGTGINEHGLPRTAILYLVRNDISGLQSRLRFTMNNNRNHDIWLVSDSSPELVRREKEIAQILGIYYCRRVAGKNRKHGAIKDWLIAYGHRYKYMVLCDADSLLPHNFVDQLVMLAESPEYRRAAILQAEPRVANAVTRFAKFQSIGTLLCSQVYQKALQAVFGGICYFGHNCLVRIDDFGNVKIPDGCLSHDMWESAVLDSKGKKCVLVHGVAGYEESPANYLECIKRNTRWARGTLETIPLVFSHGLSAGMRFQLYYSSHLFLSHIVFLFWLISGLLVSVEQNYVVFHQGANLTCGGIVFSGIFLAQFIASTTMNGIRSRLKHLLFTTLMLANNLVYVSLAIITALVPVKWQPMRKNPGAVLGFKECVISLWPSAAAGLGCFVIGARWALVWLLFSLPIVTGLTLAIPLAWWSGRRLRPESLTLKE